MPAELIRRVGLVVDAALDDLALSKRKGCSIYLSSSLGPNNSLDVQMLLSVYMALLHCHGLAQLETKEQSFNKLAQLNIFSPAEVALLFKYFSPDFQQNCLTLQQ